MISAPKFHSDRLVYRAIRSDDEDSKWLSELMGSPINTLLASPGICCPVSYPSERSKSQLEYVKSALVR